MPPRVYSIIPSINLQTQRDKDATFLLRRLAGLNEWPMRAPINKRSRLRTLAGNSFNNFLQWVDYLNHRYVNSERFTFDGDSYYYFVHMYNTTWKCERAVEIPIISKLVSQRISGNILEVGNVLSHYSDFKHDIIDKYEQAAGVINIDVLDFATDKKYDLIVAISTLEHIGWDETPREPQKVVRSINHLKSLLSVGGLFVFSVPSGYNSYIDEVIRSTIDNAQLYHLKRIGIDRWVQTEFHNIDGVTYGSPWGAAQAVTIAFITNN